MTTEWRPIPGFPDYEVSNTGLVQSYKRRKPHILKPGTHPGGYRQVGLRQNDETHILFVSHLVLLTFRGPCPDGCEACHNDGDPTNDHLSNLRWDTHAANMQDMSQHITLERARSCLIETIDNEAFVNEVRTIQRKMGMTQGELANHIGVHQGTLSKLYSRGIQDGIVIKILRKYPHLVHLF